jgi:uncharacterized protein with FMN-binding domain
MQIFAIILVVVLAGVSAFWFTRSSHDAVSTMDTPAQTAATAVVPTVTPASSASTDTPAAAAEPASSYKDGTYTATGGYQSPAGPEHVTVSLTLKDQVVTDATFSGDATNPRSVMNQGKFAAGYTDLVVGKPLDSIDLTVVNGSSLTSRGFMQAVDEIKQEATTQG